MTTSNRYPTSYTILAGLAGAIAWGLPYPLSPFIPYIPFMPNFPIYESPPFQVHLLEFIISYSLAGVIAGGLFLIGLRFLPINRERFSRPALSFTIVLSSLAGMAIGSAFAILFGLGISSSQMGYSLAISLGFFNNLPDPYLSIGLVIGTALATIIICSFSGIVNHLESLKISPNRITLEISRKVSFRALIVRFIAYLIEYSSFAKYTFGESIILFMLFQVAGGALFGILAWTFCSRLKAA